MAKLYAKGARVSVFSVKIHPPFSELFSGAGFGRPEREYRIPPSSEMHQFQPSTSPMSTDPQAPSSPMTFRRPPPPVLHKHPIVRTH